MSDNITQLATTFKEAGYVIVDKFLAPAELQTIEDHLQRFIQDIAPTAKPEHVVYENASRTALKHISGMHHYDPWWTSIMQRPATLELLNACLEDKAEAFHAEIFYKAARVGTAAPEHQDNAYLHFNPAVAATLWIALDPATRENGCIGYARGSHRLGDLPHLKGARPPFSKRLPYRPDPAQLPHEYAVLKPGDAVIHHCQTIHWSGPNNTDRNRRGLVIDYKGMSAQVDNQAHQAHLAFVEQLHANRMSAWVRDPRAQHATGPSPGAAAPV